MIGRLWRERTLEQSFAASTALLVVVLIGATLVVVHSRVGGVLRTSMGDRAFSMARSIGAVSTPSLLTYNYAALQVAADGSVLDPGVAYVAIHDKEGNLAGLAQSVRAGLEPGRELQDVPEVGSASNLTLTGPGGASLDVLEVAVPVRVGAQNETWGTVRVGLTYNRLHAKLRALDMFLLLFGGTLGLIAVLSGQWLARRITAPLRGLSEGVDALAEDRTAPRIRVEGAREIAELGDKFNRMTDRLGEKARESREFREALESLNSTLESQVRERTRALAESEAQYKTLVEHSPDSIVIVQRGHVRFANQAFLETFGLEDGEITAPEFSLARIFDQSSAIVAAERIEAWQRGESPNPVDIAGRGARGDERYLELRGSRIEYRGEPAAECLLIDNTETRRLRDRLTDTERLRALGELSSGVAHDFNNLLGAILGRVQLLKRSIEDPDIDRDLDVIERAAVDGRETVRRIMEFTRKRQDDEFSQVDLAEVIRDAAEITRTRWKTEAERRNITIRTRLDLADVPTVLGKDSELREVFTNLILNAIDAMPQGGTLTLTCATQDGQVVATVGDTGVGMTDEIRRHLFDPFFTTKGMSGTGLGLSVVYGIVHRHEGDVAIDTALGEGTRFRLTFPVAAIRPHDAEDDAPIAIENAPPSRILVIDDEADILEILRETLAAEGHTVETAQSGRDGVRLAELHDFDLVFTDLGMPDMSGWEVAQHIQSSTPSVPVVLVTGWGASLDDDEVERNRIAAVVHKPFNIDHVVNTTASVLSRLGDDLDPPEPDGA